MPVVMENGKNVFRMSTDPRRRRVHPGWVKFDMKLPPVLIEYISEHANKNGLTRPQIVRYILKEYYSQKAEEEGRKQNGVRQAVR